MKRPFPIKLIKRTDSVLSLFSAYYGGEQDVKYIHEAKVTDCVLVDNDSKKLLELPYEYIKVCQDAYSFIDECVENGNKFDVVVSDQWTTQDERIHVEYFERLLSITRRVLILSCTQAYKNDNTKDKYLFRSEYNGGVYWMIIEKI